MKLLAPLVAMLGAGSAIAAPASLIHQTKDSVIVRLGADGDKALWQEVTANKASMSLWEVDLKTRVVHELKARKRPFGPAVYDGLALYGAGNIQKKVDVIFHNFLTGKSVTLDQKISWIIEPSIEVLPSGEVLAAWETTSNIDGDDMAIRLFRGDAQGRGQIIDLIRGPVLRDDVPPEFHKFIHNEYPELSNGNLAFQSTEWGPPSVYRREGATAKITRLSPSSLYQERPAIAGPWTVWEESERGFSVSDISTMYGHDSRTGEVFRLNAGPGFHFQARARGNYAVYGAKREPAPGTPSLRVYSFNERLEINAQKCFPGSIFDFVPLNDGLVVAQATSTGNSRLLYASWAQIRSGCPTQ